MILYSVQQQTDAKPSVPAAAAGDDTGEIDIPESSESEPEPEPMEEPGPSGAQAAAE